MRKIKAQFVDGARCRSIAQVAKILDLKERHQIDQIPWPLSFEMPIVWFAIAYDYQSIVLKYFVIEKQMKAEYTSINDPVYKDSCVEFFIGFDNEAKYYNFEFNAIGNCLCGYGEGKRNRTLLPLSAIEKIKTYTVIPTLDMERNICWEISIQIPFDAFVYHQFKSLKGHNGRANFYKCGDDLKEPHYLCWNLIEAEDINFHVPAYFGKIEFI